MTRQKFKFCFYAFSVLWLSLGSAKAEIWLKDIPVNQLKNLYTQSDYDGTKGYLRIKDHKYPAFLLKNFPADYNSITDEAERNALFFKILAPLALKLNQELQAERQQIAEIADKFQKDGSLNKKDRLFIEKKAEKYDIFTRLKETDRYDYLLSELLNRVDRIPPSIMLTAAALETNMGTSRIVKDANSLYKTLVWHTDEGLKPAGETEDTSYRIKIYPDIYASMQDFALKINSHKSFAIMRNMRRERRERTSELSGPLLVPYVYGSSALRNYAGIFDYTLTYYELLEIDKSSLDSNIIPKDIIKKYQKYITQQ